eukprot:6851295-Prorocentrum_lima.AAC.1
MRPRQGSNPRIEHMHPAQACAQLCQRIRRATQGGPIPVRPLLEQLQASGAQVEQVEEAIQRLE